MSIGSFARGGPRPGRIDHHGQGLQGHHNRIGIVEAVPSPVEDVIRVEDLDEPAAGAGLGLADVDSSELEETSEFLDHGPAEFVIEGLAGAGFGVEADQPAPTRPSGWMSR